MTATIILVTMAVAAISFAYIWAIPAVPDFKRTITEMNLEESKRAAKRGGK